MICLTYLDAKFLYQGLIGCHTIGLGLQVSDDGMDQGLSFRFSFNVESARAILDVQIHLRRTKGWHKFVMLTWEGERGVHGRCGS